MAVYEVVIGAKTWEPYTAATFSCPAYARRYIREYLRAEIATCGRPSGKYRRMSVRAIECNPCPLADTLRLLSRITRDERSAILRAMAAEIAKVPALAT